MDVGLFVPKFDSNLCDWSVTVFWSFSIHFTVCSSKLDLAFVIDAGAGSEQGGKEKMAETMEFGRRVASAFKVSPEETRIGKLLEIQFNFDSIKLKHSINYKINNALIIKSDSQNKVNKTKQTKTMWLYKGCDEFWLILSLRYLLLFLLQTEK